MDAPGNDDIGGAGDGWQTMGRRWPDWFAAWRDQGRHNGGPADLRAAWLNAAPVQPADELGSMQLLDELAVRRQRNAAIAAEREALAGELVPRNSDYRFPDGWEWEVWKPPGELGEPAGWLDPAGPDPGRELGDWRADLLDELDGANLAPAVQLAAAELDAAGDLDTARKKLRKALGILDGIEAELDELDARAAAKLGAACAADGLGGDAPAGLDDQAAELGGIGDQAAELGGRGELVEGDRHAGELVDEAAELDDQAGELGELVDEADKLGELGGLAGPARDDA